MYLQYPVLHQDSGPWMHLSTRYPSLCLFLMMGILLATGCDSSSDDGAEVRFSVQNADGTPQQGLEVGVRPCVKVEGNDRCTLGSRRSVSAEKAESGQSKAVELGSFEGDYLPASDQVELTWTTLSEANNVGFRIKERLPGGTFTEIAFVEGAGTTSEVQDYRYLTRARVLAGDVDYRLVAVEVDGDESASPVETVTIRVQEFTFFPLYPNPAADRVTVGLALPASADLRVAVETLRGETLEVIASPDIPRDAGQYQFRWEPFPELPDGVYTLDVKAEYADRATDDTTQTVVVLRPDPVVRSLGTTGSDGSVTLTDQSVLDQLDWEGIVEARNSNGFVIAQMTASRRVLVEVTDPETGQTQTYQETVPEGGAQIDLTWSPPSASVQ